MLRDLAAELDALPDTPSVTWNPAAGDTLIGIVRVSDRVSSKFDDRMHPHLVIETRDDTVQVFGHHTVLAQELDRAQPQVGDRIAIRRLADVPGKNYRRYKVLIDRPEADDIAFAFGANDGEVTE